MTIYYMKTVDITAHMIIQNEEKWVWYVIQSVLPFVKQILIYDTGSQDNSNSIIRTIKDKKVVFEQKGNVTPNQLVELRNEQIRNTKTKWFLLIDGDEVWPKNAIIELVKISQQKNAPYAVVSPVRMCIGDIYHVQDSKAGKYHILGKTGHYNIRLYQRIQGYSWHGTYPLEFYSNAKHIPIQNQQEQLIFAKNQYWHMSYLPRSTVDTHRRRVFEFGRRDHAKMPDVFTMERPAIVPAPDVSYSMLESIYAGIRTPLVWVKRQL